MCSDANTPKEEKQRKGKCRFKGTRKLRLIHFDMQLRRVCAITSFEGFARNQLVFRFVAMCFLLSETFFVAIFIIGWNFLLKSRLGSKTWQPMASIIFATTFAKRGACPKSSALWLHAKASFISARKEGSFDWLQCNQLWQRHTKDQIQSHCSNDDPMQHL